MSKYDNLVGRLTREDTYDLASTLLPQMVDEDLIKVLNEVLSDNMKEELAIDWSTE
jgi:hypothetical protein